MRKGRWSGSLADMAAGKLKSKEREMRKAVGAAPLRTGRAGWLGSGRAGFGHSIPGGVEACRSGHIGLGPSPGDG